MKRTHFTKAQIMGVLHHMEGVMPAAELCREHGMRSPTLYKWRAKHGGIDASVISEKTAMAEKNCRLKRIYACVRMQNDLLKAALGKK
ncbi:transposase [Cognatishimia sp. F0-27]|nr:transposase [Cognatishimia sp. F0-27]